MVLLGCVLLSSAAFAASPEKDLARDVARQVLTTSGVVASVDGHRVTVRGEGSFAEVVLSVDETAYLVDGQDGEAVDFAALQTGDKVTAYYGPRLTRSIPPQGSAIALVRGERDGAALYMQAEEVTALPGGGVRVLCSNRDRLVTILPEVFPQADQIRKGTEMLVWYDFMTLSLPGQATAKKARILTPKQAAAEITIYAADGYASVGQKRVQIRETQETVYLPLRAVAEAAGYDVRWTAASQKAELVSGARYAALHIGSMDYGKHKMRVRLPQAPYLADGTTMVPLSFFSEVLDLPVKMVCSGS